MDWVLTGQQLLWKLGEEQQMGVPAVKKLRVNTRVMQKNNGKNGKGR